MKVLFGQGDYQHNINILVLVGASNEVCLELKAERTYTDMFIFMFIHRSLEN
jgi:hypothetical protein